MKIRIKKLIEKNDNISGFKNLNLENVTVLLSEDISLRKSTILTEPLEKTYTYKGDKIIKIIYTKYVSGGIYYRESNMYAYKDDDTILSNPISTRTKQYFKSNIIDFQIKLFKQALTKISSKALEVDKLVGNTDTSDMFNALLDETTISKGKSIMFTNGNLKPFIDSLNDSINPILGASVPDWKAEDSVKMGLPSDFIPTIKDWLLSYFNESNFQIYPQIINEIEL